MRSNNKIEPAPSNGLNPSILVDVYKPSYGPNALIYLEYRIPNLFQVQMFLKICHSCDMAYVMTYMTTAPREAENADQFSCRLAVTKLAIKKTKKCLW